MWTIAAIVIVVACVLAVVMGALNALLEALFKRLSDAREGGLWGESWRHR